MVRSLYGQWVRSWSRINKMPKRKRWAGVASAQPRYTMVCPYGHSNSTRTKRIFLHLVAAKSLSKTSVSWRSQPSLSLASPTSTKAIASHPSVGIGSCNTSLLVLQKTERSSFGTLNQANQFSNLQSPRLLQRASLTTSTRTTTMNKSLWKRWKHKLSGTLSSRLNLS